MNANIFQALNRIDEIAETTMHSLPALDGVQHRFVDLGGGVTIHVAEAGPVDGPPVMLVHGFPQNWWEWRHLIGPLVADGHRVLCPDLRGAGWSSAPPDRYRKIDMADDIAAVLDRLQVGPVTLVAHDWGGPVAFLMMLRQPGKVTGFFGVNTVAPWARADLGLLRHLWRFWYQLPLALPMVGPQLLRDPGDHYLRMLLPWLGAGFAMPAEEFRTYTDCMRDPGHAVAGSRWYRTFLTREFFPWLLRGEYTDARITVPVRWLHGTADPVLTGTLLRGYAEWIDDFTLELVDDVGHWLPELRPELLLDLLRSYLHRV